MSGYQQIPASDGDDQELLIRLPSRKTSNKLKWLALVFVLFGIVGVAVWLVMSQKKSTPSSSSSTTPTTTTTTKTIGPEVPRAETSTPKAGGAGGCMSCSTSCSGPSCGLNGQYPLPQDSTGAVSDAAEKERMRLEAYLSGGRPGYGFQDPNKSDAPQTGTIQMSVSGQSSYVSGDIDQPPKSSQIVSMQMGDINTPSASAMATPMEFSVADMAAKNSTKRMARVDYGYDERNQSSAGSGAIRFSNLSGSSSARPSGHHMEMGGKQGTIFPRL